MTADTPRHHPATIALHWLTVLLVTTAVLVVVGRDWLDGDVVRQRYLDLHRLLGLSVLAITATRVVVSRVVGAAAVHRELSTLFARAAAASHGALYLLLLALPVLGWAQWSASGKAMQLFGALPIPALLGHDRDLAETLSQWHEITAWTLVALVGTHALAALWHHHFRHDHVLRSMLPPGRRSAPASPPGRPMGRAGTSVF